MSGSRRLTGHDDDVGRAVTQEVAWFALGQPFLKFTTITWIALVGHVLYGIVLGWCIDWIERRTV